MFLNCKSKVYNYKILYRFYKIYAFETFRIMIPRVCFCFYFKHTIMIKIQYMMVWTKNRKYLIKVRALSGIKIFESQSLK